MSDCLEQLEPRRLLAGGPAVVGFKISPRSPDVDTGSLVFTVTYNDADGIDPTSFGNRDLRIAGPNGYARYATAAGSVSNAEGTRRTVRYKIPARGGRWDASDNGTYPVQLHGGEVFDTLGNASDPRRLGKFSVNISSGGALPGASPNRMNARVNSAPVSTLIDDLLG
ncbi:hypothetical protein BH09PLA1_BH09PLA1_21280 [soil metagenome]